MKAVRLYEPIGPAGLKFEDVPDPTPAIGDVLVQVRASGITPTELYWPLWQDRLGHKRDYIVPAHEFSGVVTALAYGAAGFEVGDEVYGLIDGYRDGAAAEFIAVEARDLALKPKSVDFVHAAALPQAGLTSWQALFDHGRLTAAQIVLILGAGGALGRIAVQLACGSGARVLAAGRASVEATVRADRFINLEQPDWVQAVGEVDLVYDLIGGDVIARAQSALKPGGTLVTVVIPPEQPRSDIRIVNFIRAPSGPQLAHLATLVDSGKLESQVGAVYPLSDTRGAFEAKDSHAIPGKVILQP